MVVLMAFIESEYSCCWSIVWCGDTLQDLSRKDFEFFKSFYGMSKLSLRCAFPDEFIDEFGDLYE